MFKPLHTGQIFLLPPSFSDFLGEGHEAVILDEIINTLDCSALVESYDNQLRGTSAYHPVMLLKLLFWGYMNQTFSSRRLAARTKTDLASMYLCGNNQPDFRTIARFRVEKGAIITGLFVQIVEKAKELWLITYKIVSTDGTKIYADASKYRNVDAKTLEKQMQAILEESRQLDALEDATFSAITSSDDETLVPQALRTKEGRDARRAELATKKQMNEEKWAFLKQALEAQGQQQQQQQQQTTTNTSPPLTRFNRTDTGSRLMQMKKKDWWNGYNAQVASEKQFILATTINNASNDINELIPMLEKLENTLHMIPEVLLDDKGYASEKNYDYAEAKGIDAYIPHPEHGPDMINWKYNKKTDTYTDTEGNLFSFKHFSRRKETGEAQNGTQYGTQYGTQSQIPRTRGRRKGDTKEVLKNRKDDDFHAKVYEATTKEGLKKTLTISKNWLDHCKKQDEKLATPEGKALYKLRCSSVEPIFGNIKRNLWFERFSLRWLVKVEIEWNIITMVHNLQKLIKFSLA